MSPDLMTTGGPPPQYWPDLAPLNLYTVRFWKNIVCNLLCCKSSNLEPACGWGRGFESRYRHLIRNSQYKLSTMSDRAGNCSSRSKNCAESIKHIIRSWKHHHAHQIHVSGFNHYRRSPPQYWPTMFDAADNCVLYSVHWPTCYAYSRKVF